MSPRLPDFVLQGVEAALAAEAHSDEPASDSEGTGAAAIRRVIPIAGGCVSPAARVETAGGRSAFVKWSMDGPAGLFEAEAEGLRALARAAGDALRVPGVLGVGTGEDVAGWILLEYVPSDDGGSRGVGGGPGGARERQGGARERPGGARDGLGGARKGPGPAASFGIALGRGMAALHRHPPDTERPGWHADNFIGPLPQSNTRSNTRSNGPHGDWPDFWRAERIHPQLRLARDAGYFPGKEMRQWEALLDTVETLLEGGEEDGISLVHGDFWSGNAFPGPGGEPVVIDPAVYRGHREVDVAMAELFGGFPADFLPAYREAWPLGAGYERARRDVYQLYPLLVHVNLFGGGYAARVMQTVGRLLRV